MKTVFKPLLATLLSVLSVPALADNQISFNTQIEKTLANDELQATLSKTAQATDVKTLANTLNTAMNYATTMAKKYPNVKVATGRQHTYPRYNSAGKIIGHTGEASINITSQDFAQASELIAELQESMSIDSLEFGVSDATKKAHKKAIMSEAIAEFKDEASFISKQFGASDYKLVKVELNHASITSHYERPVAMMAEASSRKVAEQSFEAGDSRISYQIAGVIELVK